MIIEYVSFVAINSCNLVSHGNCVLQKFL